jgi:hypothetical protein
LSVSVVTTSAGISIVISLRQGFGVSGAGLSGVEVSGDEASVTVVSPEFDSVVFASVKELPSKSEI